MFATTGLFAQDELLASNTSPRKGAFNEHIESPKKIEGKGKSNYYYRHHKKMTSFYTGYVIEITTADLPLRRDYFLFKRFGNVKIDHLEKEGGFSYLITGFKDEKTSKGFLNNIVLHHAPEARVIYYHKGKRKEKK
ncbi:MAG: hypothetical protein ACPG5P_00760 [Saprospiraceae bacterium]